MTTTPTLRHVPQPDDGSVHKTAYREWTIDSRPTRSGHHWHAWCELERNPTEDDADGQIFHFSDIGYFDSERAAHDRAIAWAKAWLDENF
ncbi:hypothetical protein AWB77_04680 [Caballeronia fortuita]|uniref:Uncharacterized protein n=1 Tax=Caballeronia fortuita TaxID=1777138 RepID=A0A158CXI4_9BURK|nr:hypothetical protein AWB77_04680 [Caballeronia fortuita]